MKLDRDTARELAAANRAYLASPAGYGKTHAIAEAVKIAHPKQGKQLILTHTHAGVHALQSKLAKQSVPRAHFSVETISGWALKYASAFRRVSGLTEIPRGSGWETVYPAARACLQIPAIASMLTHSYGGIFVDEYQDCTKAQHALILDIANLLPCRILGDYLQGIFDFSTPSVDMTSDLESFVHLEPLTVPYRWLISGSNELGEWLIDARNKLESGQPLHIADPVKWIALDYPCLISHCKSTLSHKGSVVVAHKVEGQAHSFSKKTGGIFKSMEEMECDALMAFAVSLDVNDTEYQVLAFIEYVMGLSSNTGAALKPMADAIRAKSFKPTRYRSNPSVSHALWHILQGSGPTAFLDALECIENITNAVIYRRELLRETQRTFRAMATGQYESYQAAAIEIRDRTRRFGRPPERVTSSRILLIKGLEYDHAIVADAGTLGMKELYVAITRGARTLAIQSSTKTIAPKQKTRSKKTIIQVNSQQKSLFEL